MPRRPGQIRIWEGMALGALAAVLIIAVAILAKDTIWQSTPVAAPTPLPIPTDIPAPTVVPTDVPTHVPAVVPTDVPTHVPATVTPSTGLPMDDTNVGNPDDAILGGNLSDWIAKFGQPGGEPPLFERCPDGSYGNYITGVEGYPAKMVTWGAIMPDQHSVTEIVTNISGNQCDLVGRKSGALFRDAERFLPPGTSPAFALCDTGDYLEHYYLNEEVAANRFYHNADPFPTDCHDNPLPDGTIRITLSKASDDRWGRYWDLEL